ncbi:MAG TPA: hypothetical protein VG267_00765 [Terracidiphilus sp.]|nr:hypothetical protein [Terracidiphilus sp.]
MSLVAPAAYSQVLHERPAAPPPAEPAKPAQAAIPAQSASPALPAGTAMQVEIVRHYPMRAGELLDAQLVHPIFLDGKLAIPAGTPIRGLVTALKPDSKTRLQARFDGDFTPFHIAQVQFSEMMLDGQRLHFTTHGATTGTPVLRLTAAGPATKHDLIVREWDSARQQLHDRIAYFTAPGFGDRAKLLLYHQLPYHPERIPAHTAWTFELAEPLPLPDSVLAGDSPPLAPTPIPGKPEIWQVRALLTAEVTSATAHPGDSVQALVVEPVYDKDGQLVVPQNSTLVGKVTTAKRARSLGRNGKLRFNFQQIRFPAGAGIAEPSRNVEGSLGGATTQANQELNLDAEGTVTPKNNASAIAPLLLTMLAGRALDSDGNLVSGTAVASNGFGLVGRIVGVAAGSRNFAAGLGYYAAALSFSRNFLHSGRDVDFPRDTRIEIETSPLRAPVLKPSGD